MSKLFKRNSNTSSSSIYSIYSNIFKSKNITDSILFLNKISDEFKYDKNDDLLNKTFFDKSIFDHELYIILMLSKNKLNIVPEILDIVYNKEEKYPRIIYNVNNMMSLRDVFDIGSINFHYIINELIMLLKNIQFSKLLIGNLNIDTIYIKNDLKIEFYIVDFSNSTFSNKIQDLDFQSLYISLNENNIISDKNLSYFDLEFDRCNNRKSKEIFTQDIIDLYTQLDVQID